MTTIPPGDQCKTCTTAHAHLSGLIDGKSVHTLDYFLGKYPCCRQAYDTLRAHSPAANPFDDDEPVEPFGSAGGEIRREPEVEYIVNDLTEALRLTVEYVGYGSLPATENYSWFAAMKKYAPDVAARMEKEYKDQLPHDPEPANPFPGAQPIPGPDPQLVFLPQPTPQPYPLWVTLTNAGVTAAHCLVLAWQHHPDPEQIQILIGGCNGPEWVTPAQWEKTKFETDGTVGIRIEGTGR